RTLLERKEIQKNLLEKTCYGKLRLKEKLLHWPLPLKRLNTATGNYKQNALASSIEGIWILEFVNIVAAVVAHENKKKKENCQLDIESKEIEIMSTDFIWNIYDRVVVVFLGECGDILSAHSKSEKKLGSTIGAVEEVDILSLDTKTANIEMTEGMDKENMNLGALQSEDASKEIGDKKGGTMEGDHATSRAMAKD
ncbi:hypothetical protein ACJX0J_015639, partial [Zea mays]